MEKELLAELERDGIVRLPGLLTDEQLRGMQRAFGARLRRMRWNNSDGYERTERYRYLVEDVLTLDQGFLDLAIHPLVKGVIGGYLGDRFELVEAKGWKSLSTHKDFHGWHADTWYDQTKVSDIPREVKLAFYLSDAKTGAFNYVAGSHRRHHPHVLKRHEVEAIPADRIAQLIGPAGTAFLFDSSGTHRQGVPILEPRQAIFYIYHDPDVPLEQENLDYHRYHPLLLNAAFLGDLTDEDRRILGFGNKKTFIPAFERRSGQDALEALSRGLLAVKLQVDPLVERIAARLQRMRGGPRPSAAPRQREAKDGS